MNKVVDLIGWVRSNFLYLTITFFVLLYIWWFRLNPIVFAPGELASDPLIFGLALLFIYIFIIGLMKFSQKRSFVRALSYVIAVLFFAVNTLFVYVYFPRLEASTHFGKTTYFITSNFPFLECCGYHQFTKWEGIFQYESNFYGYNMPQVKFIYDKKTEEVSLVDVSEGFEKLYETFGKSHRSYEGYAKLETHLYYSSAKCNRNKEGVCETWTYVLYQCEMDNTSCTLLPIEYTTGSDGWVNLQANEATEEIDFYFESHYSTDDETLIYTYGQSPRCFVDGCIIIK